MLSYLRPLAVEKRGVSEQQVSSAVIAGEILGPESPSTLRSPDNLEDQLKVYSVSALVYRCATIWSDEIVQVPFRIFKSKGRVLTEEVTSGPVWDLLEEINNQSAFAEFIYVSVLNLALTGNAFWWKVRDRSRRVRELWGLRPSEVEIERISQSSDLRYTWRPSDAGYKAYEFESSSIVHLRIPSPLSDVWGMGPVRPASDDIRADQQAKRSTLAMMDNSAMPIGYLKSDQVVTEQQSKIIRQQWREVYGGPRNAGRIAVLGHGSDFRAIAVQPRDLEYLNQRKLSRSGIINAFGIPPIYVGVESENFGNRREQRRQLWQDKLISIFSLVEGQITERLLRDFDRSYVGRFDYSKIDVFIEILGGMMETAERGVRNRIVTPNEARTLLIRPFCRDLQGDVVGGDDFIVPQRSIPSQTLFNGGSDVPASASDS